MKFNFYIHVTRLKKRNSVEGKSTKPRTSGWESRFSLLLDKP